jgi:hypothetical protein
VTPGTESCASLADEDCDGLVNEEGVDCECVPGSIADCYPADPSTLGVGLCAVGTQVCSDDGTGYGPCEGAVVPMAETCLTPDDEDCDGESNEEGTGCVCLPDSIASCYPGPAGTLGVGLCAEGTQVCAADGTGYGPCEGAVVPTAETCLAPDDEDCDGESNEEGEGCVCLPDSIASCYSGPPNTLGVGLCAAGTQTCNSEGTALGPCVGETLPLPENCATSGDEDCDGQAAATCTGTPLWSKRFGAGNDDTAFDITTDGSDNVLVTGYVEGVVDFGGGPLPAGGNLDLFVAKFDAAGNHLWSKRWGDNSDQYGYGIATDSNGNVYVAGTVSGTVDFGGGPTTGGAIDIFLLKLDAAGNHVWSKRFGHPISNDLAFGVAVNASRVAIVGHTFSVDFGGGMLTATDGTDAFVAEFDLDGNHQFSKFLGGANTQSARDVAFDPSGNTIVGGWFLQEIDLGAGPLASAGFYDTFVVKLDAAGNYQWGQRFGDAGLQSLQGVAVDGSGNIALMGYFEGSIDFGGGPLTSAGNDDVFFTKFSSGGALVSATRYGDVFDQFGNDVAFDASGNALLAGYFYGAIDFGGGPLTSAGSIDGYLAKMTPSGTSAWSLRFGDTTIQSSQAVAADSAGNVLLAGNFEGTINLDGTPLTSAGGPDMFIAKFAP